MTTQRKFGYANPFANRQPQGFNPAYVQPQQQGFYPEGDYEQDPDREVSAYLKIGFQTNNGVKFLNFGRTDKQLRDASPLEHMILEHWRNGGDVNELLEAMVLEIHDANPDNSNLEFVSRSAPAIAPKKTSTKRKVARTATTEAEDDDVED